MNNRRDLGKLWISESKKDKTKKYIKISDELLGQLQTVDPSAEVVFIYPNNKRPDKKDADYQVVAAERLQPPKAKPKYAPAQNARGGSAGLFGKGPISEDPPDDDGFGF